jgi:hypothetical protein
MALMILEEKQMMRISTTTKTKIEYSTNGGMIWMARSASASYVDFQDLINNGKDILANTSKGLYYSTTDGMSWHNRG